MAILSSGLLLAALAADLFAAAEARGSLTLADCLRATEGRAPIYAIATEGVELAEQARVATRSLVLPRLTLEDTWNRQNQVTITPTGGTAAAFSFADTRNELLVRLRQPIFAGLRDLNLLSAATAGVGAEHERRDDVLRRLRRDTARAFYTVLFREREVRTLEDVLTVERERAREMRARQEAGLARRTEVLLVESQLAGDEARLTRALNDLQIAREDLAFVTGGPLPDLPLLDPPLAIDASGDVTPLVAVGQEHRSDLRERRRRVEAAAAEVRAARGAYWPVIGLEAAGILDRHNFSTFATETDWTVQIDFTFPLYEGGRLRADHAAARSRLRQAELDRDETAMRVELEVRNAWLTQQSDAAQVTSFETAVRSAEENDGLIREEYRAGLATNLEVIAAQNQLLTARLELERARYQVKLDDVDLRLVQGLPPELIAP